MIDLDAVEPGDVVTIADVHGNRAQGFVMADVQHGALSVAAFGTAITFARPNRNGRQVLQHGLRVYDHQPQLFAS